MLQQFSDLIFLRIFEELNKKSVTHLNHTILVDVYKRNRSLCIKTELK
jgi:hypothetical protein